MMMKRLIIAAMIAILSVCAVLPAFAAEDECIWAGDQSDEQGIMLASRFEIDVIDKMMSIPIYDVLIGYKFGSIFNPIKVNMKDVRKNRPEQIVWIGRYNGFNEEKITKWGENEKVAYTRFTCSVSGSGNKFYGVEGLVSWTGPTKRTQDRLCIVWDSIGRSRAYLGISFPDLMASLDIDRGIDGYRFNDNHENLINEELKDIN